MMLDDKKYTPKDEATRVIVESERAASALEGWIEQLIG